ncbi:hypothetical protein LY474_40685 [Myxococcus stipitatus]|uniref:hypothetical protein n=1 Tax=Myxococcus stipitatus TaxID=83455 RepID=UPI001F34D775|nr:hypothetical protein [Myxococcus stipitatus]MCE9674121.1 hypothetical protein [Myxococcus stipitatus]
MTKTFSLALILAVLALASPAQAQPRFTPTPLPQTPEEVRAKLSFSTTPGRLFPGWPMVVTVYLRLLPSAEDEAKPGVARSLVVTSRTDNLSPLVRFELARFNETLKRRVVTPLRLRYLGGSPRQVSLQPGAARILIGHFGLTEQETAALALVPGSYIFRAHFDSRSDTQEESWKGTAFVGEELQVHTQPSELDANLECEKVLATREYLRATGAAREALDVLDSFLARTPETLAMLCWAERAALYEQAGNTVASMEAYCKAARAEGLLIDEAVQRNQMNGNRATISEPQYEPRCHQLKRELTKSAPPAKSP